MSDFYQLMSRSEKALRKMDKMNAETEYDNKKLALVCEIREAQDRGDTRLLEELRLKQNYLDRKYAPKKVEPLPRRTWEAFKESEFAYETRGIGIKFLLNVLTLALYMLGITALIYLMSWLWG